jgi:GNAT superfamily N-acetyltransferase
VAVQKAAIKTAKEALETRSAATIEVSVAETKGLNFVRHYLTNKGTYVGDNYGIHSGVTAIAHETEADNDLQVIKFDREEGKDVVIVNFQAHPHLEGKTYNYSSQTVGAIRVVDLKDGSRKRISPLYIISAYRGRGYAQAAMLEAERIHGADNWQLDTILQEVGNCYLYEKMGYHRTGHETIIKDNMIIVDYEKD